jgi:hypothetical protein
MDNTINEPENLSHKETEYPVASMAFYGPDDQFASKVVVSILMSEQDKEPTYLHRWFADELDVRMDATIIKEIMEYIKLYQARRVVMVDRIIGCPHEEGIDYPRGEVCPKCPFWANRDRWTGKVIGQV